MDDFLAKISPNKALGIGNGILRVGERVLFAITTTGIDATEDITESISSVHQASPSDGIYGMSPE